MVEAVSPGSSVPSARLQVNWVRSRASRCSLGSTARATRSLLTSELAASASVGRRWNCDALERLLQTAKDQARNMLALVEDAKKRLRQAPGDTANKGPGAGARTGPGPAAADGVKKPGPRVRRTPRS